MIGEYSPVASEEVLDGPVATAEEDGGERGTVDPLPKLSFAALMALNAFVATYSVITVTLTMLVLPKECEAMFSDDEATGLAMLLGIAGVSQLVCPIAGYYSDQHMSKYGRRRSFALYGNFGAFIALVGLYLLKRFTVISGSVTPPKSDVLEMDFQVYRMSYFSLYTLLMISINVCYAAYAGLVPDLVASSQYGEASGAMALQTTLGSLIGMSLVGFLAIEPYSLYLIFLTVTCAWLWCGVSENSSLDRVPTNPRATTWERIKRLAAVYTISIETEPDFFYVWISRLSYYTGMSAQAFMQFFLRDIIKRKDDAKEQTALVTMVGMACASIVALPCGSLSDKMGRKKPLVYMSCVVMAITFLGWIATTEMQQVLLWSALFGIGNGTYLSIDYALACATMPDHGENARFLAIWGVAAFLGATAGPLICGPALYFIGKQEDPSMGYTREGYAAVLGIGSCFVLLAAVLVRYVKIQ